MIDAAAEAALRDRIDRMREAADVRQQEDPPLGFVADEAGGDPILWDNVSRGVPRATEHGRYQRHS